MARVLVIPDLHLPVAHKRAIDFLVDIYNKHDCNKVICIGDMIDHNAISRHIKNPLCPSAGEEYQMVLEWIQQLYDTFPEMDVIEGNHDKRPQYMAEELAGVPDFYFKEMRDVWNTPNWKYMFDTIIDGVYYFHGLGSSGKTPALNKSNTIHMPVVMGHTHSVAGVHYGAGPEARWFGLDVGCLIDRRAWQFAYGKHMPKKPILGCGVVIEGTPYFEIMPMENYHVRK